MTEDMGDFILPLTGDSLTIEEVGGKAINLAKMFYAGFNVPPAFAISAEVYNRFLDKKGLKTRIAEVLSQTDFDDDDSLSTGAASIREMITSEKIFQDIIDSVYNAISKLGGEYYAVRSSAVSEDLPDASFAGQQDTFLNVRKDDVITKAIACWASYWNDRAVKYRQDASIPHLDAGIAVVVQRMVKSEISGVMFTANPIDGSKDIVIEASWGLGESIASGIVTPDRFVLDRQGNVIDSNIRSKEKGYFLIDGENTLVDIDASKVNECCADDKTLKEVFELGVALEKHFNIPQDVEWAVEDGNVYILQSRAVTTLTDESEKDDILWTRAYGDEYWADATTPLFYSVMGKMLTDYVNHEGARMMGYKDLVEGPLLKLHKSRVYFNSWVLERVFSYYPKFIRSKELLNYFPLKDQERISQYPTDVYHTVMSQLLVMVRDADGMMNRTAKAYKRWAAEFMDMCKEFDATDLTKLSDDELVKLYYDIEKAATKHYQLIRYGMVSHSIVTNLMIKNWLIKWLDDADGSLYAGLISGLPDNKTVATNIGYSELAKIVRSNSDIHSKIDAMESEAFLQWMDTTDNQLKPEFDNFIANYGHRSNTREILVPRWKEDRAYVLGVVKLLSRSDLDLKAMEGIRRKDREDIERDVILRIKATRGGHVKAKLFSTVLGLAQTYLIFRENQRFYLDHILFRQRLMLLEIGRRLCERSLIDEKDDVFFLFEEEAFGVFRGTNTEPMKRQVSERKREFYRYQMILPPKFLKNGIDFDDTVDVDGEEAVYGAAASPGVFTGTARVVDSVKGLSEIQDGDILITSNTDPGWTAVFSRLGGLITETGGILSHGAVISREYKIPAVTAVKGATKIFITGQKLTIDGNAGVIYIVRDQE